MVKQLAFTHVKTVVSLRPSGLPKLSKSTVAPSESVKAKPAIESIRRGPSTVAELLEQERAVRAQSRNALSSPASPTKDRKNSTPSATSIEHTPTRGERLDRAIVERRRLYIHNMVPWTKKRNVADFFIGYNVGAITMYVSDAEGKSCSADFQTYEQAKRAMKDLDRTLLLGRVVDIEVAKSSLRMDEEGKDKHPLPLRAEWIKQLPSSHILTGSSGRAISSSLTAHSFHVVMPIKSAIENVPEHYRFSDQRSPSLSASFGMAQVLAQTGPYLQGLRRKLGGVVLGANDR
ncbi:hypothetical protein KCU59_g146, partial [Aureobasidium melanogenum]